MITVACVRTGTKYGIQYVERLRNMVKRHLPVDHEFICLTDQPEDVDGITFIPIGEWSGMLPGWWAKMLLLSNAWRGDLRTIYLDLDTVVVGDLTPLAEYDGAFALCRNFTQLSGHPTWPCKYASCAMSIPPVFGAHLWDYFMRYRETLIEECRYGDQQAIERLYSDPVFLQEVMPAGFFLGKRDLGDHMTAPPDEAAIVVFGGASKPHNSPFKWVREAWV